MAGTGETLRSYWPILVVAAGVVASAAVAQFQIGQHETELVDQAESIDEIEEDVELIQRQLIQRQGEVELRTQRIEIEQKQQGDTLDEILRLLQQGTD